MTTEERLEKLERELANLRAELAAEVVTRKIAVCDENGKTSASLTVTNLGPILYLHDENGKVRAALGMFEDQPGLYLYDENGKTRAVLAVTSASGGLAKIHSGPHLILYHGNGKTSAQLCTSMMGPQLTLYDENGKERMFQAVTSANLGEEFLAMAMLTLSDDNGKAGVGLTMTKDGPRLVLSDNGKPIWSAPR